MSFYNGGLQFRKKVRIEPLKSDKNVPNRTNFYFIIWKWCWSSWCGRISILNRKSKSCGNSQIVKIHQKIKDVWRCLEWNFHRTPVGYTAKKKERRKRNRSYQGLLAVAQQPSPPLPLPPFTHAARLLGCLGPVIRTRPPPPIVNRPKFSDFKKSG